jgi:glycosyltransferase involved in cell wall biosynthesis
LLSKIKVLHIIPNLGQGGAERQLLELLDANNTHEICQLLPKGYYDEYINSKGIKNYNLNMKRKVPDIRAFFKLNNIISISKPDIIHCWMYHSCLLEVLLRKFRGHNNIPLIWGLRCSNMDVSYYSSQLNMTIKACSYFSSKANFIINNSYEGKKIHDKLGFSKNSIVIPNGIDIKKFIPNKKHRLNFRNSYNISDTTKVLLCVARVDPMKDHNTLLKAFDKIRSLFPNVLLILAGLGTEKFANEQKVLALGTYESIQEVYKASDIIISSSAFGEGFSNAIGEGMASGLIPISTDVGDAKKIIAETGKIIPIKNYDAMYQAIKNVINYSDLESLKYKNNARERIKVNFSKEKMINSYNNIYKSILTDIGK